MKTGENTNGKEDHLEQDKQTHEAAGDLIGSIFGNDMDAPDDEFEGDLEDGEVTGEEAGETAGEEPNKGQEGKIEGDKEPGEGDPAAKDEGLGQYGFIQETLSDILPDHKFESAEDYQTAVKTLAEQFKEVRGDLESEVQANETMVKVFDQSPELVSVIRQMRQGKDFYEALYGVVDKDAVVPDKKSDPEGYAKYVIEREKQLESQRNQKQAFETNMKESQKEIDAFKSEAGLDDTGVDKVSEFLTGVINDLGQGKVTKQVMDMAYKAMNYDKDLAGAKEKGEIEGKNKAAANYRRQRTGDGLPKMSGSGKDAGKRAPRVPGKDFLESLEHMGDASESDTW